MPFVIASFRNALEAYWPRNRFHLLPDAPPERLLFIRTDRIGDNVIFGGVLEAVRRAWPSTRIGLAALKGVESLYRACSCVDELIPLAAGREERARAYREINRFKPDWIVNPMLGRNMLGDRIVRYCHARVRLGFSVQSSDQDVVHDKVSSFDPYYTHLIPVSGYSPWQSEFEINRLLLRYMGIPADSYAPRIWTSEEDVRFARALFEQNQWAPERTLVFFSSASNKLRINPRFKEHIVRLLREDSWNVIAVGSAEDAALHECPELDLRSRWINLCGKTTLQQTAELMRLARLSVGVDTGPVHIAGAVGATTVVWLDGGFFGRFQYRTSRLHVVCKPLGCYYCQAHCIHPEAYCMTQIAYEPFRRAVADALAGTNTAPTIYVSRHPAEEPAQDLSVLDPLLGNSDFQVVPV